MHSRRLYDDMADTARREAEAALSLTREYIGALEQVEDLDAYEQDLSLEQDEIRRYEQDIAAQIEEADACFEDGLGEDVIYDRRRDAHVMPDADRDIEDFYNALDDAYIAVAVTLDALAVVEETTDRQPLDGIDLEREYPDIEDVGAYDEHLRSFGLDDGL